MVFLTTFHVCFSGEFWGSIPVCSSLSPGLLVYVMPKKCNFEIQTTLKLFHFLGANFYKCKVLTLRVINFAILSQIYISWVKNFARRIKLSNNIIMPIFRHSILHLSKLESLDVCQISVRTCTRVYFILATLINCNISWRKTYAGI